MVRPDLDDLLNALLPFAKQMLEKYGEFIPFAAVMSSTGEIASVAGDIGNEHPDSQEVIDFLTGVFQRQALAGEIKACGICIDSRVIPPGQTEKTDAIRMPVDKWPRYSRDLNTKTVRPLRCQTVKTFALAYILPIVLTFKDGQA
jgi:hypothetical protein